MSVVSIACRVPVNAFKRILWSSMVTRSSYSPRSPLLSVSGSRPHTGRSLFPHRRSARWVRGSQPYAKLSNGATPDRLVAEEHFLSEITKLGFPSSILPAGLGQDREKIDGLLSALEAMTPVPDPLVSGSLGSSSPLLFGSWKLVYASNGTVVTRTSVAQALVAASALPGVGLCEVQQQLLSSEDGAAVETSNLAVFGLGPLGEWDATIYGSWTPETGSVARVAFDAYSVQLVGAFGWRPLQQFFKLKIPLPEAARQRTAKFTTSYLSQQMRIARGGTGNVFVFLRS